VRSAIALSALALAACLSSDPTSDPKPVDPLSGGGGSDTETLTGLVATSAGVPVAGASVKLLPADYDPSHPDTARIRRTLTDSAGHYRFEKVDTARLWNVIAGDPARKAWALARGLKAGPGTAPLALSLGEVFLFSLHGSGYGQADSGIAYFPGTDILARCNGTTTPVDTVPAGANRFIVESHAGWQHDTTLTAGADTVRVLATPSGLGILYAQ